MKKFMILVTLMAFFVSAPLAMAQAPVKKSSSATKVKCCVKGECKELTKADCKKQGKQIRDCKKCK